jgi:hypothetical protein
MRRAVASTSLAVACVAGTASDHTICSMCTHQHPPSCAPHPARACCRIVCVCVCRRRTPAPMPLQGVALCVCVCTRSALLQWLAAPRVQGMASTPPACGMQGCCCGCTTVGGHAGATCPHTVAACAGSSSGLGGCMRAHQARQRAGCSRHAPTTHGTHPGVFWAVAVDMCCAVLGVFPPSPAHVVLCATTIFCAPQQHASFPRLCNNRVAEHWLGLVPPLGQVPAAHLRLHGAARARPTWRAIHLPAR